MKVELTIFFDNLHSTMKNSANGEIKDLLKLIMAHSLRKFLTI